MCIASLAPKPVRPCLVTSRAKHDASRASRARRLRLSRFHQRCLSVCLANLAAMAHPRAPQLACLPPCVAGGKQPVSHSVDRR